MSINYYEMSIQRLQKPTKIYLFLKQEGFSENYISNLRKDAKNILINTVPADMRTLLKNGDVLKINKDPNTPSQFKPCNIPLEIVFEDDEYLVLNKPSGLATMPTKSHYDCNLGGAILNYLQKKDKNAVLRVVNRLDKDASGLILVAKNSVAYQKLSCFDKTYFAVCHGQITKDITINKPILTINKNGINQMKRVISPEGQNAVTYVEPVKYDTDKTLIKVKIANGRTHQIRLHLSSIGHPLFGDPIYGTDNFSRTLLHLQTITFHHYVTNKQICLSTKLPSEFEF